MQAHGVKSIAADLYAEELRDCCVKVETAAKEGDLAQAVASLPEVLRVAQLTVAALRG